jgi:octaprenyl-diphosphate synthase
MILEWIEYKRINSAIEELGREAHSTSKIMEVLRSLSTVRGKRTRPIIALLSSELCGGSHDDVMNFAVAIELIHAASLIHDDVIDKGTMRRNVETLHMKYGVPLAILMGDWLISKAVELVSIYDEHVIRDFARLGMKMVDGEVIDIYSMSETANEEDYFQCICAKTAEIFSYSAENACKIVSNDTGAASSLSEYGRNLGIAYQLVDDLLEFLEIYGDKSSELESRTLPVIYEETYGFEESIWKILDLINRYTSTSKNAIQYFEPCGSREKLLQMTEYMTTNLLHSYGSNDEAFSKLIKSFHQMQEPV